MSRFDGTQTDRLVPNPAVSLELTSVVRLLPRNSEVDAYFACNLVQAYELYIFRRAPISG